jgi:uncharacterized protein YidB (DUF937 family)
MLDKMLTGALQQLLGERGGSPLMQIIGALLNNSGGIGGLIEQFQRAGMEQQMQSWIGTGQNLPISLDQLIQVFGADRLQQMAGQAGMPEEKFGGQLAQLLPQVVDQLTPQGRVPESGFDDVLAAFGRLTR